MLIYAQFQKANREEDAFLVSCASCGREIGYLSFQELSGIAELPQLPLAPGLVCFDCYDRQCDCCGAVLPAQKDLHASGYRLRPIDERISGVALQYKGQVCKICALEEDERRLVMSDQIWEFCGKPEAR